MSILLYLQVFSTKFTESWFVVGSFCGMWKMWNLYFVLIIQYLSFCIEVVCMGEYLCNNKSKYAFFSYFLYLVFYLCVWLFGGVFEFVLCLHLKKLHVLKLFCIRRIILLYLLEELQKYKIGTCAMKNSKNVKCRSGIEEFISSFTYKTSVHLGNRISVNITNVYQLQG